MQQVIVNSTVDGVLSILFAGLIIIIADAVRVWFGLIRGRKQPVMSEAPWEESHLDVDGNAYDDREPVGAGSGGRGGSRSDE